MCAQPRGETCLSRFMSIATSADLSRSTAPAVCFVFQKKMMALVHRATGASFLLPGFSSGANGRRFGRTYLTVQDGNIDQRLLSLGYGRARTQGAAGQVLEPSDPRFAQ